MTEPKVRVTTWIPEDLRNQWEHVFGEYGSISWLMETAMREMLAQVSGYPSKEAIIRTAIREFASRLATERQVNRQENLPHGNPSPANR